MRTFFKDEPMFLDAQRTQASSDNVIIRRSVVLGGDPIDVFQKAVHRRRWCKHTEGSVDQGEKGGGISVSLWF